MMVVGSYRPGPLITGLLMYLEATHNQFWGTSNGKHGFVPPAHQAAQHCSEEPQPTAPHRRLQSAGGPMLTVGGHQRVSNTESQELPPALKQAKLWHSSWK